jgi:hypothetical protein
MVEPTAVLDLPGGDPAPLAPHLDALVAASRGGWVTLLPGVPDEAAPPPRSALARLFSGQGPMATVCTWVAPQAKGKPPHVELGVLHATGPKVAKRLDGLGLAVPPRWVVLADHPKRGLVVAVPPDATPMESVTWLLDAGKKLCRVPMTGMWRATIHAV